jgi:hypothetical protein
MRNVRLIERFLELGSEAREIRNIVRDSRERVCWVLRDFDSHDCRME